MDSCMQICESIFNGVKNWETKRLIHRYQALRIQGRRLNDNINLFKLR